MNHDHIRAGSEHTGRSYSDHRKNIYEDHARRIAHQEMSCRPERPRIQPSEVTYIGMASNAPDVETFLKII